MRWLHDHIYLLIGLLFAVFWWWIGLFEHDENCPRVIKGYDCRGRECDHSIDAIERAKEDMGYYDGRY